jgi:hypothetical protein
MATWSHRTVTSTREEWQVPAAQPWGACVGDVYSAIAVASTVYRKQRNLPQDYALPDDALRFHVTDDAIRISFTTEETTR